MPTLEQTCPDKTSGTDPIHQQTLQKLREGKPVTDMELLAVYGPDWTNEIGRDKDGTTTGKITAALHGAVLHILYTSKTPPNLVAGAGFEPATSRL